jgi:regulator of CtrA degradation
MSSSFGVITPSHGVTIPFRKKSGNRDQFMALFREGMALVEETANYLDGDGRREAKTLKPFVSLAYATESMRLTTRLTQLATWLLARRAEFNGEEVPPGTADTTTLLLPIVRTGSSKGYDELPERLKSLIEGSYKLHEKIYRLVAAQQVQPASPAVSRANPVANQVARIAAAFDRR